MVSADCRPGSYFANSSTNRVQSRERSAWTAHRLCNTGDMTIKRLDHVSVVVDDLAAAIAFFTALGMTLEGEMPVEARGWTVSTDSKVSKSTSL